MAKKRYWEVRRPSSSNGCIVLDNIAAQIEVCDAFEHDEPGEELLFTLVEMTEEEFKSMPEFDGW